MRTLINVADWLDEPFGATLRELDLPFNHHRKPWEFVSIVQTLRSRGLLDGTQRALGLGTGTEPLCYYFANHAREVVATDLFTKETSWDCARLDVEAAYNANPFPYARERLTFKNMDMRAIDLADSSVDFVWSTSSVEHVDSVESYLNVFNGISRVLRPGGIAVIVTEFNLRARQDYHPGMILVDVPLLRRVEEQCGLRVVGPLDLSVDDHPYLVPFNLDVLEQSPMWRHVPNIWAYAGGLLLTSACVVFEKADRVAPFEVAKEIDHALVDRYDIIGQQLRRTQLRWFRPDPKYSQLGTFSADRGHPELRSEGVTRQKGCLAFGPYVHLPPGRYRALFDLQSESSSSRPALVDVAATLPGSRVRILGKARAYVPSGVDGPFTAEVEFEAVPSAAHEFRVHVGPGTKVAYRGCRLISDA